MDHGPSFGAVQSRSLRGYPLLHAVRTGLVHRTQLHAPSAAPRVGRPARLPCRGGLPPHSFSAVTVAASPFSILSVWFFLKGAPRRKRSCPGKIAGACPGACPGKLRVRARVRARNACSEESGSPPSARPLARSSARPLVPIVCRCYRHALPPRLRPPPRPSVYLFGILHQPGPVGRAAGLSAGRAAGRAGVWPTPLVPGGAASACAAWKGLYGSCMPVAYASLLRASTTAPAQRTIISSSIVIMLTTCRCILMRRWCSLFTSALRYCVCRS